MEKEDTIGPPDWKLNALPIFSSAVRNFLRDRAEVEAIVKIVMEIEFKKRNRSQDSSPASLRLLHQRTPKTDPIKHLFIETLISETERYINWELTEYKNHLLGVENPNPLVESWNQTHLLEELICPQFLAPGTALNDEFMIKMYVTECMKKNIRIRPILRDLLK